MEQKTNLIDTEKRERINAAPVVGLPRSIHLIPMDTIAGFEVRPGFYEINGATAIPGGVNFTVHSHNEPESNCCCLNVERTDPMLSCRFRTITVSEMCIP